MYLVEGWVKHTHPLHSPPVLCIVVIVAMAGEDQNPKNKHKCLFWGCLMAVVVAGSGWWWWQLEKRLRIEMNTVGFFVCHLFNVHVTHTWMLNRSQSPNHHRPSPTQPTPTYHLPATTQQDKDTARKHDTAQGTGLREDKNEQGDGLSCPSPKWFDFFLFTL